MNRGVIGAVCGALLAAGAACGCRRASTPSVALASAPGAGAQNAARSAPSATESAPVPASDSAAALSPESGPDLAGFIACQRSTRDWGALSAAFMMPDAAANWGWQETKIGSGLLKAFKLKTPIVVFGERVSTIAFSGSSVVAVLEPNALPHLVADLNLTLRDDGNSSKIYGRRVKSDEDHLTDVTIATAISLTASTSDDYPGSALVGCSYEIDVR